MRELELKDYEVKVTVAGNTIKRSNRALMLFKLIEMILIETRATVSGILKTLTGAGMASIMEEVVLQQDVAVPAIFSVKLTMWLGRKLRHLTKKPPYVPKSC